MFPPLPSHVFKALINHGQFNLLFFTVFKFQLTFLIRKRLISISYQMLMLEALFRSHDSPYGIGCGPVTLEYIFLRARKDTLLLLIIVLIIYSRLFFVRRMDAELVRTDSSVIRNTVLSHHKSKQSVLKGNVQHTLTTTVCLINLSRFK
jgi:hypothetical protein